jgi:hypothetical protein
MKFPHPLQTIAAFALIALPLLATPAATAQTIISNETLVSTTLVVNKHSVTALCGTDPCYTKTPMFAAIPVTCPAATGQTCTFHISLNAKVSIFFGNRSFYQFLVDGAAPTIGPTDEHGDYTFALNITTEQGLPLRQSYPADVVATVTNSSSNSHRIMVSVGCVDNNTQGGCEATAHWSSMRVDVFEP